MSEQFLTAQVDLDCPQCGLTIHEGDSVTLGRYGWVHPVCAGDAP